jgi:branched-chain amino acid transport system permease protein
MAAGAKRYLLVTIAAAIVASWFSAQFNRYYLGISIDIAINIILAVSLNLINGHTGQFSLGHAGFMAVGAYTAASLTWILSAASQSPILSALWFALALVIGGCVAAAAGLAVGVPSLRLRGDYLAIVTLGFGEIIRVILQTTDTLGRKMGGESAIARMFENMGGASGMKGIATLTSLGWAWALAAITVFVVAALVNSTYGRGFIAVHDDEVAASAMGINPTRYKVTAFVIGAFFAGVAGGLYAHHKQFLSPSGFDFMKSIDIVVMVILGGMGRTAGVILAAIILTVLPELLRGFAEYRMILYALMIIALMMARPQGLFTFGRLKGGKAS